MTGPPALKMPRGCAWVPGPLPAGEGHPASLQSRVLAPLGPWRTHPPGPPCGQAVGGDGARAAGLLPRPPSLEQTLSGSHKALVEMQDIVAELLRTVPREHPAAKVRGGGAPRTGGDTSRRHPSLRFPEGFWWVFLKSSASYFKNHVNSLYLESEETGNRHKTPLGGTLPRGVPGGVLGPRDCFPVLQGPAWDTHTHACTHGPQPTPGLPASPPGVLHLSGEVGVSCLGFFTVTGRRRHLCRSPGGSRPRSEWAGGCSCVCVLGMQTRHGVGTQQRHTAQTQHTHYNADTPRRRTAAPSHAGARSAPCFRDVCCLKGCGNLPLSNFLELRPLKEPAMPGDAGVCPSCHGKGPHSGGRPRRAFVVCPGVLRCPHGRPRALGTQFLEAQDPEVRAEPQG